MTRHGLRSRALFGTCAYVFAVAAIIGGAFFATIALTVEIASTVPPQVSAGNIGPGYAPRPPVPSGQVEIAWRIEAEKNRLLFSWTESGGPVVYAPIRRSFGTRLIKSLGQQLKGEVQLSYSPAGFAYTLDVPMASLVPAEPAARSLA
jgi:hypothetical protein